MMFGVIVDIAIGLLCIVLGLLIWKKQKINILHSYHYKNVKKENLSAYTRQMGIGQIIIGVGICVTGLFNLFESVYWHIPLVAGLVIGLLLMHNAQKKYNGTWFS